MPYKFLNDSPSFTSGNNGTYVHENESFHNSSHKKVGAQTKLKTKLKMNF